MSTISDCASGTGNDASSSVNEDRRRIHYAIPYVEIRNTSVLLPPGTAQRTTGKRVILPCYAAMESDFLANCLQGLSGLPGCETALLGAPWHATDDEPRTNASTAGVSPAQTELSTIAAPAAGGAGNSGDGGGGVTTSATVSGDGEDATATHANQASADVPDLARADFFRPPTFKPQASPTAAASSSLASPPPAGRGADGAAPAARSLPTSSHGSPSLVPRPPTTTPPTLAHAGRLAVHGTPRRSIGDLANTPVPLRGGIRSQWGVTSVQTEASVLYSAFVRQNHLGTISPSSVAGDEGARRALSSAGALHLDISTVTAQMMDDAEESEARNGQTNILTAMFMPVAVPETHSGASVAAEMEDVAPVHLQECKDEGGSDGRSGDSSPNELCSRPPTGQGQHHRAGQNHHDNTFACFASNAVPRMPSYEFPQLSDDTLIEVASFMVRRSTADRNCCTTSTCLSLCDSLGDPSRFTTRGDAAEREEAYQKGLELMMASSYLLL